MTEFIQDPDRIEHLTAKIQQICDEIISKPINEGTGYLVERLVREWNGGLRR